MRNRITFDGREFTDTQTSDISMCLGTSLLASALEADAFSAVVKCDDPAIEDFTQGAPIVYYHREKQRGFFYAKSVTRIGANRYRLEGTSAVGLLIQRSHVGGIYTGQTVEEVIGDICGPIPVSIKNSLKSIKLYGYLPYVKPPSSSARDNLARVLFAIGATVKSGMTGSIRIESLWNGLSSAFPAEEIFSGPSVAFGSAVSKVVITEHQYIQDPNVQENVLFDGSAQLDSPIVFPAPMHSLSAEGLTILESGANYAILSGTGTLTGKAYTHNTRQISKAVAATQTGIENIKTFSDNGLISLINSAAVADRVAKFYACATTIKNDVRLKQQLPGDVISTVHPYNKKHVSACIQSLEVVSGASILRATAEELVGFLPDQISDIEYFDTVELITESKQFVVPDGVTSITAVLVGGAQGGYSGGVGKPGKAGGTMSFSYNDSAGQYIGFGYGGEGGEGGVGGQGGKILQITLDVTPSQVFEVDIGIGGEGGAPSSDGTQAGTEGTATTFGEYSTDSGAVSQIGFTDPISGNVYGAPGARGLDGGKGTSSAAEEGEYESHEYTRFTVTGPAGTFTSGDKDPEEVATEGSAVISSDVDGTTRYTDVWAGAGQALGGGAAYGADGPVGNKSGRAYVNKTSESIASAHAYAPAGANGADAALPGFEQTIPGNGGNGGHGGGGGGGQGLASAWYTKRYYSYGPTASLSANHASSQSVGGQGSAGGKGANGCVLVYFRIPKTVKNGPLVGADKRLFLDSLGRRFVL